MVEPGVKHPAYHPMYWGENEKEWLVEDHLGLDELEGHELLLGLVDELNLSEEEVRKLSAEFSDLMVLEELVSYSLRDVLVSELGFSLETAESIVCQLLDDLMVEKELLIKLVKEYSDELEFSEYEVWRKAQNIIQHLHFDEEKEARILAELMQEMDLDDVPLTELLVEYIEEFELGEKEEYGKLVNVIDDLQMDGEERYELVMTLIQEMDFSEYGIWRQVPHIIDHLHFDEEAKQELVTGLIDEMRIEDEPFGGLLKGYSDTVELDELVDYAVIVRVLQDLEIDEETRTGLLSEFIDKVELEDETSAKLLYGYLDQLDLTELETDYWISAPVIQELDIREGLKGELVTKHIEELGIEDEPFAKVLKWYSDTLELTEVDPEYSISAKIIQNLEWNEELRFQLFSKLRHELEMVDDPFVKLLKEYSDELEFTNMKYGLEHAADHPLYWGTERETTRYSITAEIREDLEAEQRMEMELVTWMLQELNIDPERFAKLLIGYLDELELTEMDPVYKIRKEVKEPVEFEEGTVYWLIAELVTDLELDVKRTHELIALFGDSMYLEEEVIYKLLMQWEDDLTIEDMFKIVGAIEFILRIRDKIVADVDIVDK